MMKRLDTMIPMTQIRLAGGGELLQGSHGRLTRGADRRAIASQRPVMGHECGVSVPGGQAGVSEPHADVLKQDDELERVSSDTRLRHSPSWSPRWPNAGS
jgi:hypothetical protein